MRDEKDKVEGREEGKRKGEGRGRKGKEKLCPSPNVDPMVTV